MHINIKDNNIILDIARKNLTTNSKVVREKVQKLTDLPNIGISLAEDLRLIGITSPIQLQGKNPLELYAMLCEKSGTRQDPCVLDVFMSITDFMNASEPKVWWDYTQKRKASYDLGKKR